MRTLVRPRSEHDTRTRFDRVARDGAEWAGSGQLARAQRARMLNATVDVCCELGAANVSVTQVVKRSGVSRRTFYETFGDFEDCFAATFEFALALATERVLASHDPRAEWREQVRDGLVALLSFLDEEPRLGRVLIVESLAGGPQIASRRAEVIAALTGRLDRGRAQRTGAARELPQLTSEGLVGAVSSVLQKRLSESQRPRLLELTNELTSMIVLPYLGAAAAKRELARPTPVAAIEREYEPLLSDPFKDAGIRLTYRTVRVLMAIAEQPGASNRCIGDTADVIDRGQISKLLGRLERAGMVNNTGAGVEKGAPNAWTLTEAGTHVVNSIRDHTNHPQNSTH